MKQKALPLELGIDLRLQDMHILAAAQHLRVVAEFVFFSELRPGSIWEVGRVQNIMEHGSACDGHRGHFLL
eukprot:scaffold82860_cov21-Tisochrysis_lutea.AAC.1